MLIRVPAPGGAGTRSAPVRPPLQMNPAAPNGKLDVFAAFLDALRNPGSYDLFEHAGELFIVPEGEGAARCSLAQSMFRLSQSVLAVCERERDDALSPSTFIAKSQTA